MKYLRINWVGFASLSIMLVAMGCSKSDAPPAPLSVDELPAALEKAFSKAKPALKGLAAQVVSSVQAKDYVKADSDLRNLSSQSGLNKEQQSIATRGVLTVHELLQTAESKGDEKAAATLKSYKMNK